MIYENYKKNIYKAVFFDFGGTLMDAESDKKAHYFMMKEVKSNYHLPTTTEDLVAIFEKQLFNKDMTLKVKSEGNNNNENGFNKLYSYYELSFQSLLSKFDKTATAADFHLFKNIYLKNHIEHIALSDGAMETINLVKDKGYHCGIISDIDLDYQQLQFKALNIDQAFHSITTSEEVRSYKPAPPIFLTALQKANCLGKESLMVGDSYKKDIIGGKNMEMTTIWINRYQNQVADNGVHADFTIGQLIEILPILDNIL